jgi:hypothetical protein
LRNEKGRVVRGPFSTLQAWLIAVSPQPGVAVAIGSEQQRLEYSAGGESGTVAASDRVTASVSKGVRVTGTRASEFLSGAKEGAGAE